MIAMTITCHHSECIAKWHTHACLIWINVKVCDTNSQTNWAKQYDPTTSHKSWGLKFMLMAIFNPFSVGTLCFMHMQTGWIQASRQVTRRLAWDPTCLLLSPLFPIKKKKNLKVLKSRRQYNLFLDKYPAFKGLIRKVLQLSKYIIFKTP